MATPFISVILGAFLTMAASPTVTPEASQWRIWMDLDVALLDTPEKAVELAEAVVRARFGSEQVKEERPFFAQDKGDAWRVSGSNLGTHALPLPVSSAVTLSKLSGNVIDYELSSPPVPMPAKPGTGAGR